MGAYTQNKTFTAGETALGSEVYSEFGLVGNSINNIEAEQLNANSVTTDKIKALAVTTAKIADEAVTTAKIADGAVQERFFIENTDTDNIGDSDAGYVAMKVDASDNTSFEVTLGAGETLLGMFTLGYDCPDQDLNDYDVGRNWIKVKVQITSGTPATITEGGIPLVCSGGYFAGHTAVMSSTMCFTYGTAGTHTIEIQVNGYLTDQPNGSIRKRRLTTLYWIDKGK